MNFDFYDCYGFLIELLLVQTAFLWKAPKKNLFPFRLACSLIGYLLFALAIYQFPFQGWANLIRYTLLFLFTFLIIHFCFSFSWKEIVFFEVAAYGVQHLTYNLCMMLHPIIHSDSVYASLSHFLLFFFISVMLCTFLSHILKKNNRYPLTNTNLILSSAVILSITIVISYIPVMYLAEDSIARLICNIYASICCILALFLQFGLLVQTRWKQDAAFAKQLLQMERKQYELTKNTIDLINTKSHDLKKQISLLRQSPDSLTTEKALADMEHAVSNYDNTANTGNKTLDLILSQKLLQAANENISMTYMINGHDFDFMDTIDLFSLFGNILDNALESVLQIENEEHRVIALTSNHQGQFLILRCDNYFTHKLTFSNGLPVTSKSNKDYHGFGLKSIKMILEKYNGTLSITTEEDIFHLFIMMPLQNHFQQ